MKRLLKEPLLHFLLLGAGIFTAYHWMPKRSVAEPGNIVITRGQIEHLAAGFAQAWQRPPTSDELAGLVRDRVREEVYCREAMAMGLDNDDTIIRRRLRQKMEFISDDLAAQTEPTEADLNSYLMAHLDSFRIEQRTTFRQVYLNPSKHGENLARDAGQLLAQLQRAAVPVDTAALGDAFLLEDKFAAVPASEIAKQFGQKFVMKLADLPVGQWQGPVESGYGLHVVMISERAAGRLPALAEVREAVRREWTNGRRLDANEKLYLELQKRYNVTIESPAAVEKERKLAEARR
jgi:hypothetical protein